VTPASSNHVVVDAETKAAVEGNRRAIPEPIASNYASADEAERPKRNCFLASPILSEGSVEPPLH
jgi:hypothetical protein